MKKILFVLLALVLLFSAVPAKAQNSVVLEDLAGTLVITAKDANTVTLHAEQTGGEPVTLTVEHGCYVGNVSAGTFAGVEKVRFTGSADMTFNIGPRTYHGQYLVPDNCGASMSYYMTGNTSIFLVQQLITLP